MEQSTSASARRNTSDSTYDESDGSFDGSFDELFDLATIDSTEIDFKPAAVEPPTVKPTAIKSVSSVGRPQGVVKSVVQVDSATGRIIRRFDSQTDVCALGLVKKTTLSNSLSKLGAWICPKGTFFFPGKTASDDPSNMIEMMSNIYAKCDRQSTAEFSIFSQVLPPPHPRSLSDNEVEEQDLGVYFFGKKRKGWYYSKMMKLPPVKRYDLTETKIKTLVEQAAYKQFLGGDLVHVKSLYDLVLPHLTKLENGCWENTSIKRERWAINFNFECVSIGFQSVFQLAAMINVGRPMIVKTGKMEKKLRTERDNASHGCHNSRCNNPEHMTIESFANNNKRNSHMCGGYVETPGGDIYTLDYCQCVTCCPKVMKMKDENLLVRGDQNWTEKDRDKYCYARFAGLPCNHLLPVAIQAEESLAEDKKRAIQAEESLAEAKKRAIQAEESLAEAKKRAIQAEESLAEAEERANQAEELLMFAKARISVLIAKLERENNKSEKKRKISL